LYFLCNNPKFHADGSLRLSFIFQKHDSQLESGVHELIPREQHCKSQTFNEEKSPYEETVNLYRVKVRNPEIFRGATQDALLGQESRMKLGASAMILPYRYASDAREVVPTLKLR